MRMTFAEFTRWVKYRNKWGPLHQGIRIDRAGAVSAVAMKGGSLEDYMPWPHKHKPGEEVEDLPVATTEQIAMAFGAKVSYNGGRKKKKGPVPTVSASELKAPLLTGKKKREAVARALLSKQAGKVENGK